jgi:sugar phosphate isomerase/epimerase
MGIVMYKKIIVFVVVAMGLGLGCAMDNTVSNKDVASIEAYDGWRLGVQTWSFKKFTLFEALDKTRSLGLNWIQAYPGQKVSSEINVKFGPDLTAEQRQKVKGKLKDTGIGIFAFGVTKIPKDEAEARKLFEFAKDMGIETIASEPEMDQFDLIDRLCKEYRIKLAIHNHPKPSKYWNPDTVLAACKGRSKWIGACTDVGHWVRSGLDPVECLKKLQGRIHDVHIKEIDDGHDVVWGTGEGRIKGVLEELHRQGYEGTFSIEYEYHWDNNVPYIRKSVDYFNSIASKLK